MRKIAFKGMRGRRKDAAYLIGVIALSLLFMTVATQLLSSISETDRQQNFNVFGEWKGALLSATGEEMEALRAGSGELTADIIESRVIGESKQAGVIGVMNDGLMEAGRFEMYEGRMPEGENEIALEMSRLGQMGGDIKVGDEVAVTYEISLPTEDERDSYDYYEERFWPYVEAVRGPITEEEIANFREILKEYYEEIDLDYMEENGKEMIALYLRSYFMGEFYDQFEHTYFRHSRPDNIIYEDYTMSILTKYQCLFINAENPNHYDVDAITREGYTIERNMTVSRTFRISGIMKSYSDRWDAGNYQLPNAFISEAGLRQVDAAYESMIQRQGYGFRMPQEYHAFLSTDTLNVRELFEKAAACIWPDEDTDWAMQASLGVQEGKMRLRMNSLAYPAGMGETEEALMKTVLFGVFLITVCAVFQILYTQLKRRTKRIALLKAVGASNAQVARMLMWESGLVLLISLPAGLIAGGVLSYGAVWGYNILLGGSLIFAADIESVLIGIALCCVSILIGMSGPLIAAMRVPPVQGIHEAVRKKQNSAKLRPQGRLTFAAVCRRRRAAQRGKSALSLGLSTFAAVIILTSVALSALSFEEYMDKKHYINTPDYLLAANYGISGREISERVQEIEKITGVGSVNVLKKAERMYISFENMKNSPSINKLSEILPERIFYEHFGGKRVERSGLKKGQLTQEPETEGKYITDLYGVNTNTLIFEQLKSAITEGSVDEDNFNAGKEAILLVPLYIEGGNYDKPPRNVDVPAKFKKEERMRHLLEEYNLLSMTTDKRKSNYYKKERALDIGDTIDITVCREKLVSDTLKFYFYEYDIAISGIIAYFPDEAIWPFSQYQQGYTLIGSYQLVNTVYPDASGSRHERWQTESYFQELYYPTLYGQTLYAVYGNEQANRDVTDLGLLSFCKEQGYTLYNYKDMDREVFAAALNNTVIICMLGLAAALIAGVILYNTEESAVEQDRKRLGVLQSMGVTEFELKRWKWSAGLMNGLIALAVANMFVFIVMLISSIMKTGGMALSFRERMLDVIQYKFSLYPWAVHIILCLAYLFCTMLIHRIPIRAATKNTPIENIRS